MTSLGDKIIWADALTPGTVADRVEAALAAPSAMVAVPGGRTPVPILAALAARPLPAGATITLTDDRIVPEDHPASNFGLLRRTLGTSPLQLTPLVEGAAAPRFDLVWIGMGADGHIASIFPNAMDDLAEAPTVLRTRPDPLPPEAPFERLTLGMSALTNTRSAILVITGTEKRRLLEAAATGQVDLPISRFLHRLTVPLTVYWTQA